jgi:hypothetical protein
MSAVEKGYLLLADLTGYTAYLSQSEIEHAPMIAGDLLETVIGRLEPPYRLAKLEGDAAFLFVEDGRAEASLLVDAVEAAYLAFRRRLRSIEGATTCDCKSCGLAPRLNLKLFLHHGSYVHTSVAGRDELAGPDVIVAHRLLKGRTAAAARSGGFALFTEAAVSALGLQAESMPLDRHTDQLDNIGDVAVHVLDLEQRWQADSARRRLGATGARPILELEAHLPIDQATAWSHLTSPVLRSTWEGPITFDERTRDGRRGVGTTTRCVTGRLATIEEIVDWRPYDYVGWRVMRPGMGLLEAVADLSPQIDGTSIRLAWHMAPDGPLPTGELERLRNEKEAALGRLTERLSMGRERATP